MLKAGCFFMAVYLIIGVLVGVFTYGEKQREYPVINREERLPNDIAKRRPETDGHPPILHSDRYEEPVPLPYPVNTSGAEDSPFILPNGKTLFFFFTPDVRVPPEKQLLDGVTGIYVTYRSADSWSQPLRVWLEEPGKLSLDGAPFVRNAELWFCSARQGYEGVNMFTAEWRYWMPAHEEWANWEYVGDRLMKEIQIGEVHAHFRDLYFHSERTGGKGGLDIWVTTREGDSWSDPVNIEEVNTASAEGWPFISSDGREMWFTRQYMGTPAIFRSEQANGVWGEPELIVSQFAAEPTLDDAGNLYFVHHFFEDGMMMEADIYVAYRK